MARRGWVAAEVAPGTWRRLAVYDDGWIELPGMARDLSDVRGRARRSLLALVLLAALVGLPRVLGPLGAGPGLVEAATRVGLYAGLLVLAVLAVLLVRWRWRDLTQRAGDQDQARRERDRGGGVRSVPGAPRWRPAPSAAAFDSWTEGATHVDAASVRRVAASREGDDHVVTVDLTDGTTRSYRSPDLALPRLLGRFGAATSPT